MEITKEDDGFIRVLFDTYSQEWRIEEIEPDRSIQMLTQGYIHEHMH